MQTKVNLTEKNIDDILEREINLNCHFKYSTELFCLVNKEGRLIWVNNIWEKVLGYNFSEITTQPFINFVHPEDVPKTMDIYNEKIQLPEGRKGEKPFINRWKMKNGDHVIFEWHEISKEYINNSKLWIALIKGYERNRYSN